MCGRFRVGFMMRILIWWILGMWNGKGHMFLVRRKLMTTGWMREEMMKVIELYYFNQNVIER